MVADRKRWTWAVGTAAAVLLCCPAEATADVVRLPEKPCPPGSVGETDHCGPWCKPWKCTTDSDCAKAPHGRDAGARACRSGGLCVERQKYDSCSGWSHGSPLEREVAQGTCSTDADCRKEATCVQASYCVEASKAPSAGEPSASTATTAASKRPSPAYGRSVGNRCSCELAGRVPIGRPLGPAWLAVTATALGCRRRRRGRLAGR